MTSRMSRPESRHPAAPRASFCGRTRREFFWESGASFTGLALSGLLDKAFFSRQSRAADGALAVVAGLQDFREHLGGALHITLLKGIGQPFEVTDMRLDLVAQALADLTPVH